MTRVARHLLALALAAAALAGCDRPSDLPDAGLSRTVVEFRAPAGGGDPAAETVTIVNAGHGTLDVPAVTIAYQEGKDWLEVLVSGSAAPYVVSLRASTGALAEGTYHATVKLSWREGSAQLSVALVVPKGAGGVPVMALSRTEVGFEAPGASGDPAAELVYVANGGRGALATPTAEIAYQGAAGWLTAGVSVIGAPYTVTLGATTAGLEPGVYTATVTLTCAGASPAQVSVTLTVPDPSFALSPRELAIDAPRGGGDPAEAVFDVLNAGRGVIPVPQVEVSYAGAASRWLTTAIEASGGNYTVAVQAHVAGLPSGVHKATLTVRGAAGEVPPRTLPVTLTVPPPEVVLSSHAVELVAPPGGVEVSGTVTVTNGGGGVLAAPVATVTYDGGAATSWDGMLEATVHGTTAPYTIEIVARQTAGATRLPPGTYAATVRVAASGAAASEAVRVTLEVPAPRMQLSAPGVAFSEYTTCPLPAPATVRVSNAGGGTLAAPDVTFAPGADAWLAASVTQEPAGSYALTLALKAYPPVDAAGVATTAVTLVDPTGAAPPAPLHVRFDALPPDLSTASVTPARLDLSAPYGLPGSAGSTARTISLGTPGGCFPPPAVEVEYADTTAVPWLSVSVASSPHRHDVSVLTSVAGLEWSDRRTATVHLRMSGRTWDVPVTLVPRVVPAGPLNHAIFARWGTGLVLTPLADGRALLTGNTPYKASSRSELFDPTTRTWTTLAAPKESRVGHGAVQLDDGRVLVCGGHLVAVPPSISSTCEVLSGASWSILGSLTRERPLPTLVTMPGGRVLVVGNDERPEVMDVATGRSTLLDGVTGNAAVKLPDGSILLAGGNGRKTWVYSPAADAWAPSGDMAFVQVCPALVPLPGGRVLAVGGGIVDDAVGERGTQIWDPGTGAWSPAAPSPTMHGARSVTRLINGKVLATAGWTANGSGSTALEVYDPAAGTWSVVGSWASTPRDQPAVTTLATGTVLLAAGLESGNDVTTTQETYTW